MDEDGFTIVKGKNRPVASRKKGKKKEKPSISYLSTKAKIDSSPGKEADLIIKRLQITRQELSTGKFCKEVMDEVYSHWLAHWKGEAWGPVDVICYGIGPIGESPVARAQLALLLVLIERMQPGGLRLVYDPVLSEAEKLVMGQLGIELILTNEECRRKAKTPTLFYMPHCGARMYNNLLWANLDCLEKVMVIGNSLEDYHIRHTDAVLETKVPYIYKLVPSANETVLPKCSSHPTAFLNTNIITIPSTAGLTILAQPHSPPDPLDDNWEL